MTYLFILFVLYVLNDINIVEKSKIYKKQVADWASFKSWKNHGGSRLSSEGYTWLGNEGSEAQSKICGWYRQVSAEKEGKERKNGRRKKGKKK